MFSVLLFSRIPATVYLYFSASATGSAQAPPLRLANLNFSARLPIRIKLCVKVPLDYSSLVLLAQLYSCSSATRKPGIPGKILKVPP